MAGSYVDLETLTGFGAEADAALAKIVRAVMQANHWTVTGHANFKGGPTGYHLHVDGYPGPISAIVATGGITARVSDTQLGVGNAVLRIKTPGKATVASGATVKVYSWFGTALTAGTHIEILPIGDGDYKLVAADCPA